MLCDNCKKNIATIHYEKVVNGVRTERHLCAECAKKMTENYNLFNPAGFITSLFDNYTERGVVCENCGTRSDEFLDTGYLGCSECYNTFKSIARSMLERVQGGGRHVGLTPDPNINFETPKTDKKVDKISDLQAKLKKAVDSEDYELAAKIRDEIRSLKDKPNKE